jgi:hypothetical protein
MRRYQPALLGGLFIGVLSALPIVQAGNLCCCLWVVLGGGLTVYLDQQSRPDPVEPAQAIIGGLLAGAIGTLISAAIAPLVFGALRVDMREQLRALFEQNSQMPSEARDTAITLVSRPDFQFLVALVTLPVYAVFSMLGALFGLAIFGKKTPRPVSAP